MVAEVVELGLRRHLAQIGRGDRFQRCRIPAREGLAVGAGDVVLVHRAQVVRRHRRIRQQPEDAGLQVGPEVGEFLDLLVLVAGQVAHVLDQFAQRIDLRAAQFVALAEGRDVLDRRHEGVGDVADVDRLELRLHAAGGERRRVLEDAGEGVEELVADAEDHRRAEHGDVEIPGRRHDDGLALALRADVFGTAVGIGAERAHVQQAADAGLLHRGDDLLRQRDMRGAEALAVRNLRIVVMQHADQVDDDILTAHQFDELRFVVDVGLDHFHLRQHDVGLVALAAAGRDGDIDAGLRQAVGNPRTDETASSQKQCILDHDRTRLVGCTEN